MVDYREADYVHPMQYFHVEFVNDDPIDKREILYETARQFFSDIVSDIIVPGDLKYDKSFFPNTRFFESGTEDSLVIVFSDDRSIIAMSDSSFYFIGDPVILKYFHTSVSFQKNVFSMDCYHKGKRAKMTYELIKAKHARFYRPFYSEEEFFSTEVFQMAGEETLPQGVVPTLWPDTYDVDFVGKDIFIFDKEARSYIVLTNSAIVYNGSHDDDQYIKSAGTIIDIANKKIFLPTKNYTKGTLYADLSFIETDITKCSK